MEEKKKLYRTTDDYYPKDEYKKITVYVELDKFKKLKKFCIDTEITLTNAYQKSIALLLQSEGV